MDNCCCDMRGMLSFLVLHMINKQPMSGQDLRKELHLRKGTIPSAGTIYPVLKTLSASGLIKEVSSSGKIKKYALTPAGERELKVAKKKFCQAFYDIHEDKKTAKKR